MIADVHGPLLFSSSPSLGRPIRAHYFPIKALLAALCKITDLFAFPPVPLFLELCWGYGLNENEHNVISSYSDVQVLLHSKRNQAGVCRKP